MTKTKSKKAPKSAKAELADGAKKIRAAEAAAKKKTDKPAAPELPLELVESKREIRDILSDHVQMLPDNIGMKISEFIPLEESLRVLDYATALGDHVGFMIGDVIVHGQDKFGNVYGRAMQQTGRQRSTLKGYVEAARKFPPEQRVAALSFSHHRELVRLTDDKKRDELLKETAALADKGNLPSTKELRAKVQEQQPSKTRDNTKPAKSSATGITSISQAKDMLILISNYLTEHEDEITEALRPQLEHMHRLYRRRWQSGHKRTKATD